MMMALGMFVFSLQTLAYQELQRKTTWRHPTNSRVGNRPAAQFTGPGDDTITLPGVLAPELGGSTASLAELREMGDSGQAWALVSGSGRVFGAWVITGMDESSKVLMDNGAARQIDFTLHLQRVDDQRVDGLGSGDQGGAEFDTSELF